MDNSGPRACRSALFSFHIGDPAMEKILVGLKRVIDYNVRVRVKSDGSGVEEEEAQSFAKSTSSYSSSLPFKSYSLLLLFRLLVPDN